MIIKQNQQDQILETLNYADEKSTFSIDFKQAIESHANENIDKYLYEFLSAKTNKIDEITDNEKLILETEDFRELLINSIGYTVCQRFDIPKGIYNQDNSFRNLERFKGKEMFILLGCASQAISKSIIAEVQRKIVELERIEKNAEQENISRRNQRNSEEIGLYSTNDRGNGTGNQGGTNLLSEPQQVHENVANLHGGKPPSETIVSETIRGLHGTAGASEQRNSELLGHIGGTIQQNESSTENGQHNGNITMGNEETELRRGNAVQGQSLHKEISHDKSLSNSESDFLLLQKGTDVETIQREISEFKIFLKNEIEKANDMLTHYYTLDAYETNLTEQDLTEWKWWENRHNELIERKKYFSSQEFKTLSLEEQYQQYKLWEEVEQDSHSEINHNKSRSSSESDFLIQPEEYLEILDSQIENTSNKIFDFYGDEEKIEDISDERKAEWDLLEQYYNELDERKKWQRCKT